MVGLKNASRKKAGDFMLKVKNLTKTFGGLTAVSDVSFDVHEGNLLGLIGPNGAGKTTIFNMIAGALQPTSGTIEFTGQSIVGMQSNKISRLGIARTFQIVKPMLNMSLFENITVAALTRAKNVKEAEKKTEEVMNILQLQDLRNVKAKNLSIGNLKKLEVARAIAISPKLLLLDEPMGGLNTKEVEEMIKVIQTINKTHKMTIVIIEHNMKAIMSITNRIVVINHGKKIADDKPNNVTSNSEVIQAYLGEEDINAGSKKSGS